MQHKKNKILFSSSNTGRRHTEIIAKTKKSAKAGIKKVTQVWEAHYIAG